MRRGGKGRPTVVLALVLLTATALGLAAGARVRRPAASYPDYADVIRFDPTREGGHLLPNLDLLVEGERAGHPVRLVTNSKGFRNAREFDRVPPPDITRILFLGDSFVDGMRTDQESTIGRQLERQLAGDSGTGRRVEVMVSGHNNPANAWYYFQEHGRTWAPQLVVLGLTLGNDLTSHSYKAGVVPRRADDGRVRLELRAPCQAGGRDEPDLLLPDDAYTPPSAWDGWRERELAIRVRLAAHVYGFAQDVPPLLGPQPSRRRRVYAADFLTALGLFYRPPLPAIRVMYHDLDEVLAGFDRAVRDAHARLVVVLFPLRMQVSPRDWRLLVRAYSLDPRHFRLRYPNRRILASCARRAIRCLDTTTRLRDAEQRGEGPFYRPRGDMHFNDAGQALLARTIADYLVANGLFDAAAAGHG